MPLEPVHVMEIDRATSRLELVRVNPTRKFLYVALHPDGRWAGSPALYWYQNGKWYDTGENEITDLETIPQRFRDEIRDNPLIAGLESGPAVTKVCKFCGEQMNQSEIDQHYIEHVNDAMSQAGRRSMDDVPPSTTIKDLEREADAASGEAWAGTAKQKITPKHDANQLGRR